MTVIRPNSVAGINSITVQSGNSLAVHKANGELIRTITASSGVSTFSTLSVGTATTDNSAAKSINIGLGASISQHADNSLSFGTGGDERIRINSSGYVGIGTDNPARKVEIFDTVATVLQLNSTNTGGTSLRIQNSGTDKMYMGLAGDFIVGQGSNVTDSAIRASGALLVSSGGGNERLRIDSSGRLGIQGAPTRALLEVRASGGSNTMLTALFGANEGTTAGTLSDDTDKACRMGVHHYDTDALPFGLLVASGTNGANSLNFGGGTSLMNAATQIQFTTAANSTTPSGTTRMNIDSDGAVNIGSNPAQATGTHTQNAILTAKGYPSGETSAAILALVRGNNTTSTASGHTLGRIVFSDKQAGEYALIEGESEHAAAVGDTPGRLIFATTSDGATTPSEKVRIDMNGDVLINQPAEASGRLTIKGTNSSGSSCYAVTDSGKAREGLDITCTTVGDGNFGGAISFGCGGNGRSAIAAYQEGADDDNNGLSFFTHVSNTGSDDNAERIRLLSSGRVYINPSTSVMPGNDPSGGGEANTNGFLNLRADNGENALGLLNTTVIANNSARGTVLTGINFINRNYYNSAGKAGTGYVIRNEKGHASYMDRCDLRLIPGYDGNTLYSNRSVVFEFDGAVRPGSDDYASLGTSSAKWTVVYATNGSIQTSDENLKQNIQSLSAAEMKAAASISKLFITYKWKSKVAKEEAGGDAARIHTGVIAQRIKAALEAEGLTAANYSFWCENITWKDSEGNIAGDGRKTGVGVYDELTGTTPSTDGYTKSVEYAVRYDELLSFVAAYNEQRFTSIESRLTALEGG